MENDKQVWVSGAPGVNAWIVAVAGTTKCDATNNSEPIVQGKLDAFGKATLTLPLPLPNPVTLCILGTAPGAAAGSAATLMSSPYLVGVGLAFAPHPLVGDTTVTINGGATSSDFTYSVTLVQVTDAGHLARTAGDQSHESCSPTGGAIIRVKSGTKNPADTDSNGQVTFTLASSLAEGTWLCAYQTETPSQGSAMPAGVSDVVSADDPLDWGRARAYVAGGILLANDSSAFSSAHQFYLFNYDKAWALPAKYTQGSGPSASQKSQSKTSKGTTSNEAQCPCPELSNAPAAWTAFGLPGVDSYLEARLTAIPVASTTAASTGTGSTTSSGSGSGSASSGPASDSASSHAFLTSQKTASVTAGAYFPFLFTRWAFEGQRYAFAIAPIAKVGFNTLAGPTTQTIPLPNGTGTSTDTFESVYNFYAYGGRLIDYRMSMQRNRQPTMISFLDVTAGRYSNLPSYVCEQSQTQHPLTGSACGTYFPPVGSPPAVDAIDSAKRLYRVDIEGTIVVPKVDVFLGINANIGQRALGAGRLDTAFQPNDDVRFVLGYKTDVASLLKKLGVPMSDN